MLKLVFYLDFLKNNTCKVQMRRWHRNWSLRFTHLLQTHSHCTTTSMPARRASSRLAASTAITAKNKIVSREATGSASPAPASTTDLPAIHFPSASAFSSWLEANHATSPGLFLRIAKKAANIPSATYDSALDAALCWGWIDGQRRTCPDDPERFFLQRFTRRRKASMWSKRNVDKVGKLTEAGEMRTPGLEEVEKAKKDGRWEKAYEGQSKMEVPPDLKAALETRPQAKKVFESLEKGKRYALLLRLHTAKRTETRGRSIEKLVDDLAEGLTA